MIATAVSLIGMLAAGLVLARFLRSCSLQDLALALALVVLAGSNLFFSAIPSAFGELGSNFTAWAPFLGRLVGAFLFALSVAVPERVVPHPKRAAWLTLLAGFAVLGLITFIAAVFSPDWASPMRDAVTLSNSDSPLLTDDTLQLVVLALIVALYLVAIVG